MCALIASMYVLFSLRLPNSPTSASDSFSDLANFFKSFCFIVLKSSSSISVVLTPVSSPTSDAESLSLSNSLFDPNSSSVDESLVFVLKSFSSSLDALPSLPSSSSPNDDSSDFSSDNDPSSSPEDSLVLSSDDEYSFSSSAFNFKSFSFISFKLFIVFKSSSSISVVLTSVSSPTSDSESLSLLLELTSDRFSDSDFFFDLIASMYVAFFVRLPKFCT